MYDGETVLRPAPKQRYAKLSIALPSFKYDCLMAVLMHNLAHQSGAVSVGLQLTLTSQPILEFRCR